MLSVSPLLHRSAAAVLLLVIALVSGCQGRFDRSAMLRDLSEEVILPTYAAFAARADTLAARAEALDARPSAEALAATAEAWRAASMTWKETEAFEIGPVRDERIHSQINFWPPRLRTIERVLAEDDPLDVEAVERLSVAARGLPALEYLLFDTTGQGNTDAALLRDDQRAARRRAFAAALARDVAANAQTLLASWRPEGGDFAATWGQGEDFINGPQEAISMLTNRIVFLLEEVHQSKLGAPLGKDNGGAPDPHAAEAWRSGTSQAQILHNLYGIQHVYYGRLDASQEVEEAREEGGLRFYLETVDAALADTIDVQMERTLRAVEALPDPLHRAVTNTPAPVERAYAEVDRLLRLVEVDMMNVLGITLYFNDNDGD